jgi:hypothetical protein
VHTGILSTPPPEGTRLSKTITRMLTAAALALGMVLGAAGTAQGQGDVKSPDRSEGIYTVNIAWQAETTWEIYPICVPTVGDLREPLILPVGCRLKVTPAGRGGSEATQVGGRWTFQSNTFDALRTCPAGSKAPQSRSTRSTASCSPAPGMVEIPLTMSYKAPLSTPIAAYPLICEPGGLRRCF